MIIENILIVDLKNKEANQFDFKDQANLIISKNNIQGKSSLLKSIYFTLGLDIKTFPKGWNTDDMMFRISVKNDNKKHKIIRFRDSYKVDDSDFMQGYAYSLKLQEILGINMLLKNWRTKELSLGYSSALILPYYIDQDNSWQGIPYKSVTNGVNHYDAVPTSIFEYIFGLSDEDIQELELQKKLENNKKTELTNQIDVLGEYKKEEQEKLTKVSNINPIDTESVESQIQYFLDLLNRYNKNIQSYKTHLIKRKTELNNIEQDLEELKNLLKITRKDYKDINTICTHCNSELTVEQSLTRLNLNHNILEIQEAILLYEKDRDKAIKKIDEYRKKKNDVDDEVKLIKTEISNSKALLEIHEYIDASAKEKTISNLEQNIHKKILGRDSIDQVINGINAKIRSLKKDKKELSTNLKNDYNTLIAEISKELSNVTIDELDFLKFKNISGSGMNSNKLFLSYYLIYFNLLDKHGRYSFPFGMDSFIKNEASSDNEVEMFEVFEKYLLELDHQSFFSILNENLKYLKSDNDYHLIKLDKRVLNSKFYDENLDVIETLLK